MTPPVEIKRALIVVRTYPNPATKGVEVSCTAAITDKREWLRLFPVPWRLLDSDQQFRKYQWVQVTVTKSTKDGRPESYKLKPDGIKILSEKLPTDREWQARKDIVLPLKSPSLCFLKRQQKAQGHPTLGIFRPKKIQGLVITSAASSWTDAQLAILRQGHLFVESPKAELEKIPFNFQYQFSCDDDQCNGHKIICTDWEMGELYRKCRDSYGDAWEDKFRQRYETDMIHKNDTHFYVGTMRGHPDVWIIVGLFYPPRPAKGPGLFDQTS